MSAQSCSCSGHLLRLYLLRTVSVSTDASRVVDMADIAVDTAAKAQWQWWTYQSPL